MKVLKKVVTTALIVSMATVPLVAKAEEDIVEIVQVQEPQELVQDFIGFYGRIADIQELDGKFSILIESDNEETQDKAIFYISEETLLVSNETMDTVHRDYLKEGMKVMAYYPSDIILPMIYPPRIPAELIAIMESEEHTSVEIYNFDENLVSKDRILEIYPNEETVIIDREGNVLEVDDIKNSRAVVFYKIAALSLPAKTSPEKVIVMEQSLKDMNKVRIDGNEILLNKPMYMNEDRIMVPLRQIAESLGYEVKWNGEDKSVELTKGPHWFLVKIGQDNYNFARMMVQLGAAPELVDSTTYVPVDFLDLMGFCVNIVYDGVLNVTIK